MFSRPQVFFLFSLVSSVLAQANRNRCHPENGANRCFDLSTPCPFDIVDKAAREGIQVCPETPIITSLKRCAAGQTFQCFDPDEEPCTQLEAQLTLPELSNMIVCVDKAHKIPRWSKRHPVVGGATTSCLWPTEASFGAERRRCNIAAPTTAQPAPCGAALAACPDARIIAGTCRNSATQVAPCMHPGTDPNAGTCPSPITQGLPICYDHGDAPNVRRCDPRHATPCIDPTEECPYNIQNKTARVILPICVGREPPAGDLPRCHASHPTGAGGQRCIDPTELSTHGGQNVGGTCNLNQANFEQLFLCTDKDTFAKRCHERARTRCFHPTEECFDAERNGVGAICGDIQLDYANFANRCAVENGDLRCRPAATNNDPLCNGLKYCTDLAPAVRCDPNQITPCIDPTVECPYNIQNKTARVTLPICVGRELPAGDLPRCHSSRPDGAGGQRCIDPTEVSTHGGQNVGGTCNLNQNGFEQLSLCTDKDTFAKRCHPRARTRCFHPTEECFDAERNGVGGICADIQADYANFANRCAVENGDLRCRPAATNNDPLCNGLKYCTDLAPAERCDPNQITPCIHSTQECSFTSQNETARQTLSLCYGLQDLIRSDRPRCHRENDNAVRCFNPNEFSTGGGQNQGGSCADTDANVLALNVCEEFAHQLLRCDLRQRGRCLHPAQSCFGDNRVLNNNELTTVCADTTALTGMSRCDPRQRYRCIDPRDTTRPCADQASLKICNDIPTAAQGNRCGPAHIFPCLENREGQNNACTDAINPNGNALKVCQENIANFARCDVRQPNPCIDPVPPTGLECTIERFEQNPPGSLAVCPDMGGGLSETDRCTTATVTAGNLCRLYWDTSPANAVLANCIATTPICQDTLLLMNMNPTTTANAEADTAGQFCHEFVNDNLQCIKTGLRPAQAANAGAGGATCDAAATTRCPGFEFRCSKYLLNRCLEIAPANACFDADTNTLSRCAGENVRIGLKRCHQSQPTACIDPLESQCTQAEGGNNRLTLDFCGDKAHLMPRSHPNQVTPCLDPAQENLPAADIASGNMQSKTTVRGLNLCEALQTNLKRCHSSQTYPCIDPAVACTAADNPSLATLKYCGDRVAQLLGTANEVNRCDPLNMNPCIDPTRACPFNFISLQPNLQACAELLPAPGTKRCLPSNTNPCYFVGTNGQTESCTPAENPNFATLKVCPDAATRVNRCSIRQESPCIDPTDPCNITLNPNLVTLGICTDLVSMAPSTLPSQIPSNVPSNVPSMVPSSTPSLSMAPSDKPSLSAAPSSKPSEQPSASPSALPSASPSDSPSDQPSASPSAAPSAKPSTSASPSAKPSPAPSQSPSGLPSSSPSASPTLSSVPSATPSSRPTVSMKPTFKGQTYEPSDTPSASPSASPSEAPSSSPSVSPSSSPSASPSSSPTSSPSASPSSSPSSSPSASPSSSPSSSPSASPTLLGGPSAAPSVNCVDDPDFLLDENENRNCEWVRENPDRVEIRCAKVDSVTNVAVADACPLSCNPECEEFVPTVTPVTLEPTVSPETQCGEDDPDFLFQNREGKNCEWVASTPNKTEKRCDKTDTDGELVSTKCTFTCQLRCVCKNSKKKFRLNGEKVKCKDVGRNQCDQGVRFRGRNTFVKERCPKKCNYCFDL